MSQKDKEGLTRTALWQKVGQGYAGIQGTRPQTLGYAMADSPVGLLSWIYDKLIDWTDDYKWQDDESKFAGSRCTWRVVMSDNYCTVLHRL